MAPKKAVTTESLEMEEIKQSLNFMSSEISKNSEQLKTLLGIMAEISKLRQLNEEKDKVIAALEGRVSDLEQYTRMNDIVITGLDIKPRTYARAVRKPEDDGGHTDADIQSVEQQVIYFMNSKGIKLDERDIEACHPLPRRNSLVKPAVIVKFVNRKRKTEVIKQGKKLKGTNVYVNEHLTKKNSDIARQARMLKRAGKIQATWTSNCKILIKLNGTPEEAQVLRVTTIQELDKYQ